MDSVSSNSAHTADASANPPKSFGGRWALAIVVLTLSFVIMPFLFCMFDLPKPTAPPHNQATLIEKDTKRFVAWAPAWFSD